MGSIFSVFTDFYWLHHWFRVHLVVLTIFTDPREVPVGVFEYPRKIEITRSQVIASGQI